MSSRIVPAEQNLRATVRYKQGIWNYSRVLWAHINSGPELINYLECGNTGGTNEKWLLNYVVKGTKQGPVQYVNDSMILSFDYEREEKDLPKEILKGYKEWDWGRGIELGDFSLYTVSCCFDFLTKEVY